MGNAASQGRQPTHNSKYSHHVKEHIADLRVDEQDEVHLAADGSAPKDAACDDTHLPPARHEGPTLSLLHMIRNAFDSRGFEKFLDTLSPRELIEYTVNHSEHLKGDAKKVLSLAQRLASISVTSDHQNIFGRPAFREAILMLVSSTADNNTIYWLAMAILNATESGGNRQQYAYRPLRNALVHMSWEAKSPETIDVVCQLFARFAQVEDRGNASGSCLFNTPAVRDAFVTMCSRIMTPLSITSLSAAVVQLCANGAGESASMASMEVRNALVGLAPMATSPDAALALTAAFGAISLATGGSKLVGTRAVHDAVTVLADYCTEPEAVDGWCRAMLYMCNDDVNRSTFGTSEMHRALTRLSRFATSSTAVEGLCKVVASLSLLPANERLLCTRDVRDALCKMAECVATSAMTIQVAGATTGSRSTSPAPVLSHTQQSAPQGAALHGAIAACDSDAATWICHAVCNLTTSSDDHKRRFAHPSVVDALYSMRKACFATREGTRALSRCLERITTAADEPHIFGVRSFRILLNEAAKEAHDSTTAGSLVRAIAAVTDDDDNRIICGAKMHDTLFSLAEAIKTADAAMWWWKAVFNLCHVEVNRSNFVCESLGEAVLVVLRGSRSPEAIVTMGKAMAYLVERKVVQKHSTTRRRDDGYAFYSGASPQVPPQDVSVLALLPIEDCRDALLSLHKYATHSDAVAWLCRSVCSFTSVPAHRIVFCIKELRDAAVVLCKYAKSAEAVRWLCRMLSSVALEVPFRPLMASESLQKALNSTRHHATTTESVQELSHALSLTTKLLEDEHFGS